MRVVIYATGSGLAADLSEGLRRSGATIAAAVRNHPGPSWALPGDPEVEEADLTPELTALPWLVPLFTPANRRRAAEQARAAGFGTPHVLVDPSVVLPGSTTCAGGVWVNAGCSLGAAARYDAFALVNRGAAIGHHAHLGAFSSVGPGAVLCGHVVLGEGAAVGAGATVLPERTVGAGAMVAGGSVVTRDVPDGALVMGSPARVVSRGAA